jgi:hypothetical protein
MRPPPDQSTYESRRYQAPRPSANRSSSPKPPAAKRPKKILPELGIVLPASLLDGLLAGTVTSYLIEVLSKKGESIAGNEKVWLLTHSAAAMSRHRFLVKGAAQLSGADEVSAVIACQRRLLCSALLWRKVSVATHPPLKLELSRVGGLRPLLLKWSGVVTEATVPSNV